MSNMFYIFIIFLIICVAIILFSSSEGKSSWFGGCEKCPIGTYSSEEGSTQCTNCAAGTANNTPGATKCNNCEGGKYQDKSGQSVCISCDDGENSVSGKPNTKCFKCGPGQYLDDDACKPADKNYFVTGYDSTAQTPCPSGKTLAVGAKSSSYCIPCGINEQPDSEDGGCGGCEGGTARPDWLVAMQQHNGIEETCMSVKDLNALCNKRHNDETADGEFIYNTENGKCEAPTSEQGSD